MSASRRQIRAILRADEEASETTRRKWAKKWRTLAKNGAFSEGPQAPFHPACATTLDRNSSAQS
jgi:hypothetical protein